jgi:hypothetical protein
MAVLFWGGLPQQRNNILMLWVGGFGEPVQSARSGVEVNDLDEALRHIAFTIKWRTTIFSRYPTLLHFVITGQVDC